MNDQNLNNYIKSVINISFLTNKYINDEEPWKLKKTNIDKIKETFAPKKRVNAKDGKLIGGQKNIDVAAPFGKITGKDFAKLRSKKTKKKVI